MHGKRDQGGFTRRTFLEAGATGAVLAAAGPARHLDEIFETLANPYGLLSRAALEQMKLVPA